VLQLVYSRDVIKRDRPNWRRRVEYLLPTYSTLFLLLRSNVMKNQASVEGTIY